MKAVTRQRPKNANYSVSSNPTCTNGAPLKAKAKPKPNANAHPSASKSSEQSQPRKQAGGGAGAGVGVGVGVGGKMTKFRSLDDIPDFTDDFGKDKSDFHSDCGNSSPTPHYSPAPVVNRFQHNDPPVVSSYGRVEDKRQVPPLQVQSKAPPPLPAESVRSNMKQFSPPKKSNPAPTYFDDNSCDSVDTDLSDDDDECNHSYFSSKDDYNVDYTPGKSGGVQHKSRVVKPTKPVQKSYPTKQPQSSQQTDYGHKYDHASNNRPPKEPREINYKPYTLKQYRKIKPQEYVEYSKLKPDLNTSELVAKRANAERIKQFSKNLNDFNKVSIKNNISADEKEAMKQVKVVSKREKALQFAQNVPKPKVIEKSSAMTNNNGMKAGRNIGVASAPTSKIDELTSRHQQSKMQVEAIKKSMGL